jgi:hypothetical protein
MKKTDEWKYSEEYLKKKEAIEEYMSWSQKSLAKFTYDLTLQLEETAKTIKKLNDKIKELKSSGTAKAEIEVENVEYNKKWAFTKKILFAVAFSKKPLTAEEIFDFLSERERLIRISPPSDKDFYHRIYMAIQNDMIVSVKVENFPKRFYVLPDWLLPNGKIKPEYLKKISVF